MKTVMQVVCVFLLSTMVMLAQQVPVKIVFDVTSPDTKVHQSTVRHVKAMSQAYPNSKFEVVMYSGAMEMVLKDKSVVASELETLVKKDNVDFVICQGTMKRYKAKASDLIPGVRSVPDGILEIVEKQQQGWSYIKEGQ
ncbi:DsrE family protein [Mangrovimonas sp. YM274]|uniref:DsrE family protein n=1 Tax=Mangrovimonas sp. YM274 TaxID=3070660 RepID=UPI0027DE0649|nr:DsrE family protein [Mangrovimonas sp. YM274]WMI69179.1 DsrE family protein [Mangrovimonas sp. YM274]